MVGVEVDGNVLRILECEEFDNYINGLILRESDGRILDDVGCSDADTVVGEIV